MLNDGFNAQTSSSLLANDAPAVDNNQYSHDFSNYPATPSSTHNANGNTSGIVQRPNDPNANSTTATPSARVYPVVEVEAPENLSEGYTFDVQVNHEILTITVPHGGATKGKKFRGQTRARVEDSRNTFRIPVGGWKDSLFDFCTYGPMHPSLFMAVCCPLIALGQIYTRLNLNWHGRPIDKEYEMTSTSDSNSNSAPILTPRYKYSSRAFKSMLAITVIYRFIVPLFDPNDTPPGMTDPFIKVYEIIFYIFVVVLIARTRTYIRSTYDIQPTIIQETIERAPGSCCRNIEEDETIPYGCGVVEDYVMSCACYPCVLTQMSRHTAPYDTYEGSMCSSTGLPEHAPSMV